MKASVFNLLHRVVCILLGVSSDFCTCPTTLGCFLHYMIKYTNVMIIYAEELVWDMFIEE